MPFAEFKTLPNPQKAAWLALIAGALFVLADTLNDMRQTLEGICGPDALSKFSACYAQLAKSAEELDALYAAAGGEAAYLRAADARHEANQRERRRVQREIARTRLMEPAWGQPIDADFNDHAVIRLPDCGPDARPSYALTATPSSPPGLWVANDRVATRAGDYLLLNLYLKVAGGELSAAPPAAAHVAVFCEPAQPAARAPEARP